MSLVKFVRPVGGVGDLGTEELASRANMFWRAREPAGRLWTDALEHMTMIKGKLNTKKHDMFWPRHVLSPLDDKLVYASECRTAEARLVEQLKCAERDVFVWQDSASWALLMEWVCLNADFSSV